MDGNEEPVQMIGFDDSGSLVLKNRAYRRRKIQLDIDQRNQPKKRHRKKNNKRNYLNKRKK